MNQKSTRSAEQHILTPARVRADEEGLRIMSIEDRGRVFVELLLVAVVFVLAMGRITPWTDRAAIAMNAIEQGQFAFGERPLQTSISQEGLVAIEESRPNPSLDDPVFSGRYDGQYAEADEAYERALVIVETSARLVRAQPTGR